METLIVRKIFNKKIYNSERIFMTLTSSEKVKVISVKYQTRENNMHEKT